MKSRVYLVFGIIGVILLAIFSVRPILLKTCIAFVKLNPPSDRVTMPTVIPSVAPSPKALSPTPIPPTSSFSSTEVSSVVSSGGLRVSNPTDYPVRVALLTRSATRLETAAPAHWDFAPQEGSQTGLLLSLPDQNLNLQPGDVLVGFAQDGSRRYWGPYVVGETDLPFWVPEGKEWQLILQP